MPNTGKVSYNTLTEIFLDTGLPTGNTKANVPTDPDYIAPETDDTLCPPPAPVVVLKNKVTVTIENQSSQSIKLNSVVIRGESSADLSQAYVNESEIRLLPGAVYSKQNSTQEDTKTRVLFIASAFSHHIRQKLSFNYKKLTELVYTTESSPNVSEGDNTSQLVDTDTITGTDGLNILRLIFTDNPVPVIPPNIPPAVDAGETQTIELPTNQVTLTGIVSDTDGFIVSQQWSQVSGPNTANIVSPNNLSTVINGLAVGTYVFKLTATDNSGDSSSDTVTIVQAAAPQSLNGDISVYVQDTMPDTTFKITSVKLIDAVGTETELLTAAQDKTTGVKLYHAPKGTYKVEVTVVGTVAGTKSLNVKWGNGASQSTINLPDADVYAFDNVVVDQGLAGVTITFQSTTTTGTPPAVIYVQRNVVTGVWDRQSTAPWGLDESLRGMVSLKFFDGPDATTPVNFTGIIKLKRFAFDNLSLNHTSIPMNIDVVNQDHYDISDLQQQKLWDYTLNDPLIAEAGDLYSDYTYTYSIVSGQGYLIIP